MSNFDPNDLDPGIRRTVLWLGSLGYQTSDSGDGRSKPKRQRVLDIPHVVITVLARNLLDETDALIQAVAELGIPEVPWDQDTEDAPNNPMVEGSYSGGNTALITVINLHDGILPDGLGVDDGQ